MSQCSAMGGTPLTTGCDTPHYVPDAFFLSVLLFLGTFMISYMLKEAKNGSFFPSYVSGFVMKKVMKETMIFSIYYKKTSELRK